ncbi:transglycosylase SLT domain-containing protein [Nocardia asiatica]|uniref:transglycosylase SLT domain-containing protein n=1 Tax=Nocardia asiatica TaxID=209252 RepID=UPI0024574867|nr:transglycosylase SLT domain-containing protein [Nocardia asiatica]
MANWPAFSAGSARLTLKPRLASSFRTDVKTLLRPINESLKVTVEPKLANGFRTNLRNMVRTATSGINAEVGIKVNTTGVRTQVRNAVKGMPDVKVNVNVDLTRATRQMEAFRTAQAAQPLTLNADVDTAAAVAQLLALRSLASSVNESVNGINAGGIARSTRRLTGGIFLRPVRAIRLQVELDRTSVARAEAEVANVTARLSAARRQQGDAFDRVTVAEQRHAEVMARASASESQRTAATQRLARARRDLADATGRVTALMGQEADADNRLDRARRQQNSLTGLLTAGWRGFRSAAVDALQSAVKNVFSLSSILGIAKVALVALAAVSLVPLIGQLAQAAGVVGLLPAALSGAVATIATLVIGFRGIGDAFSAAGKAADSAGKDAEARAKSVASAQKQQAAAARGVRDAERGIQSAERGVRDAQRNTLQAQKDLNRARRDAKKDIDDLNRALGRAALTEESAAIAVAEAQQQLFQVFSDPESDAIDRARAQNNVKQALADQQDTIRENRELAEKAAEANALGVEGSEQVVQAKERVTQAIEAEGDARQSLQDAYTRLADAQAALVEAQQSVADALNDSSSAADEFEKALGKLSPNARDFVEKMLALRPAFGELRSLVQDRLFDQLGDSVSRLANNSLDTLKTGLSGIAAEINGGIRRAIADLDTDASRSKIGHIFERVKETIGPAIDGINNLVQGMLSLSEVGSDFLPGLGEGFKNLTERFRKWAESDEGKQQFRDFLQDSIDTFGKIAGIVKKIVDLVGNIFQGSDETGESWLASIGKTLDTWNAFLSSEEGQQKLRDFFDDVNKAVGQIATTLTQIANIVSSINSLVDTAGGWLKLNQIAGWIMNPGQALVEMPGGFADQLENGKKAWESLTSSVDEKAGKLVGWFYEVGTSLGDIGPKAVSSLTDLAGGALSGLKDKLPGVTEAIANFATDNGTKWGSVGDVVTSAIEKVTGDNGFEKLKSSLGELPDFFAQIVVGIGSSWSGIVSALQGPINSVIDVVNGFGNIWNKVAPKLGLPEWAMVEHVGITGTAGDFTKPLIGARWMGGPGGPVRGPGGSKDDKAGLYRLSNDEHVWTAAEVRAAGGHEEMYRMRRAVLDGGGKQSRGDAFANGGGIIRTTDPLDPVQAQLWSLVSEAIPNAVLTSAKRFVDVGSGYDLHMQGKAIDLGGPMAEIARWIYNTYPQSAELIHWPLNGWQNLDEGRPFDFGPAVNEQHRDHVHWAANDFLAPLSDEEKKGLFDRIRNGLGGIVGRGRDFAVDNLLARPLRALADQVPVFDGLGEFGQIPRAFAQKMANEAINMVLRSLGGSGSAGTGGANYDPTGGAEQWRELAMEAMRREGFDADDPRQVNAMLAQIQSESGGNPSILQQVQDVNSGGNEAQGLLQVIPGTFAAYRDPELPNDRTHPLANMVAALRYYRSRYGPDLTTFWGQGHGYDQGGILKDKHWGFNLSGLPEAVLTNPQWKMFEQFIQNMPGFNQQLQALPQPLNGGTDTQGNPGTFGVPPNPGVDTFEMVGAKAKDRFVGALNTGFNDLVSSTLGPLGLPDPRSLIPSEVTQYGQTLDAWARARAASAQASQALAQSGYQAAASPVTGAANTVMQTSSGPAGQMSAYDYSTHITIQTADTADAFRRAQQIADLRAIQHTGTARG